MGWAARRAEIEKAVERARSEESAEARVRRLAAEYRAETDGRLAVVRHRRLAEAVRAMRRKATDREVERNILKHIGRER